MSSNSLERLPLRSYYALSFVKRRLGIFANEPNPYRPWKFVRPWAEPVWSPERLDQDP
jgi:hypothetical protein